MKAGRFRIGTLCTALLLMTWPPAAGVATPGDGVLAEVPFLRDRGGYASDSEHIVIDLGKPGGKPMPLILDTGASDSVMTPGAARRLGVSVRRAKTSPYKRGTRLGRDLQFWIDTASSDTGSRSGWEVGLLGGNFLEQYTVEIDYGGEQVRFLDPRKHSVPNEASEPGEIIVPLRIQGRRPFVELEIGNGTAQFMVDTGASFELEISERLQRELGLSLDSGEVVEGRNWMGSDRKHRQQLPSVRVGDAEVGPCELLVTLREGSQWRHTNQAGADEAVLGSRFLRRFRVRIDYKHRRMSLVPAAAMEPGAAKEPRPVESLEPMPVPSDPS